MSYTEEEVKVLYEANGRMTIEEVSMILGRSINSVRGKIYALNERNPSNVIQLIRVNGTSARENLPHCGMKKAVKETSKKNKEPKVISEPDPTKWRAETHCTVATICSAVYRGESLKQIAHDTSRAIEQVEYIYERSLKDGSYNRIKSYQERSYRGEFNQRKKYPTGDLTRSYRSHGTEAWSRKKWAVRYEP